MSINKVNLNKEAERAKVMGYNLYLDEIKLKYHDEMELLVAYDIMAEKDIEEYSELTVNHDGYDLVMNLFF